MVRSLLGAGAHTGAAARGPALQASRQLQTLPGRSLWQEPVEAGDMGTREVSLTASQAFLVVRGNGVSLSRLSQTEAGSLAQWGFVCCLWGTWLTALLAPRLLPLLRVINFERTSWEGLYVPPCPLCPVHLGKLRL